MGGLEGSPSPRGRLTGGRCRGAACAAPGVQPPGLPPRQPGWPRRRGCHPPGARAPQAPPRHPPDQEPPPGLRGAAQRLLILLPLRRDAGDAPEAPQAQSTPGCPQGPCHHLRPLCHPVGRGCGQRGRRGDRVLG